MSKPVYVFFVASGAVKAVPPENFASMTEPERMAWAKNVVANTSECDLLDEIRNAMQVFPEPPVACIDEEETGEILGCTELWWQFQHAQGIDAKNDDKAVDEAVKALEDAGVPDDALDETVHDLASGHASDVNNGGVAEQARYILDQAGETELKRIVQDVVRCDR